MKRIFFQSGFTAIELLVVIGLSLLVLTALLRFLVAGYPISRVTYLQVHSTETARLQLRRLAVALRQLRQSDTGAYPLVEATPTRLIFYSNIDADAAVERVRYELVGTNIVRGVVKPTGNPLQYNTATEQVQTVSSYIQNGSTPLFIYYSGNYPADTNPISGTGLTTIKYIQFHLLIDADVNNDPPAVDIVSQVQLRNLKTNLGDTN